MSPLQTTCKSKEISYGSKMTDVVKQIAGRNPTLFAQFAKDYAEALR